MIFFIEGVDGSGKTTLHQKLGNAGYDTVCGIERMRNKWYEGQGWEQFVDDIRNNNSIIDRGFLSELVYRLFDDYPTFMTLDFFVKLCDNAAFIYCDNDKAYNAMVKRGDRNPIVLDRDRHEQIRKTYNVVFDLIERFTNCPVFRYDYDRHTVQDVENFIDDLAGNPRRY